jgi:hypothetical protein
VDDDHSQQTDVTGRFGRGNQSHNGQMANTARWFVTGAALTVIASFPLAAVFALLFRFPIPFGGYASGADAVIPALVATLFYGMLGGFVVQAVLGGIAGVMAGHRAGRTVTPAWRLCIGFSFLGALPGILTLSVLDWLIGPW